MSAPNSPRKRRPDWLVPALLIVLGVVPVVAGTALLAKLAGGAEVTPANARYVEAPRPVILHILSVTPFAILGALQFAPGLRRPPRRWHARVGRFLVVCGFGSALTGLWMTAFYPWPAGDGVALYVMRLVFGAFMLVSMLFSVDAIRRRDFAAHGAWMTRAYAVGMGAATQVLTHLPWFILVGKLDEASRAVAMGAGWVINVIVAERVIRAESRRRGAVGAVGAVARRA